MMRINIKLKAFNSELIRLNKVIKNFKMEK